MHLYGTCCIDLAEHGLWCTSTVVITEEIGLEAMYTYYYTILGFEHSSVIPQAF